MSIDSEAIVRKIQIFCGHMSDLFMVDIVNDSTKVCKSLNHKSDLSMAALTSFKPIIIAPALKRSLIRD